MALFPMTEHAFALSEKDGAIALKKLNAEIDGYIQGVKTRIRQGLDKPQFAVAQLEVKALQSAQMIFAAVHKVHQR